MKLRTHPNRLGTVRDCGRNKTCTTSPGIAAGSEMYNNIMKCVYCLNINDDTFALNISNRYGFYN